MSSPPRDVWTCPNCTLINEQVSLVCRACHLTRPEGPLTPRKILEKAQAFFTGIPDQISSAVSSALDTPILEPSPPTTPLTVPHYGVWPVPATYDPGPSTNGPQPPASGQPNSKITTLDKAKEVLWTCGRCTFINTESPAQCQVCGAPERLKLTVPQQNVSTSGDEVEVVDDSSVSSTSDEVKLVRSSSSSSGDGVVVIEDIFCESCGYQYRMDQHKQCPVCTFDDKNVSLVTQVGESAGSMEPSIQPAANVSEPTVWTCASCTFENQKGSVECEMCQKDADPSKHPPSSSTWACEKCSYENEGQITRCAMCQQAKPGMNVVSPAQNGASNMEVDGAASGTSLDDDPGGRVHSITMEVQRQMDSDAARDHFERIRAFCKEQSMKFVDDSFPPAPRSLFGVSRGTQLIGKVSQWKRPCDLLEHLSNPTTSWEIYRHPVEPSDISQGILGDCWFLSALSVVAERPELVERIMISKQINEEGAYQVRLCNDGTWQTILIDDLLPTGNNGALVCSKAKRKQLWVPLIEKALAKVNGSYESLISGRCLEGLATLTGAPCESLLLQEKDMDAHLIWAKLLSSKEAGFLMGASCGGGQMKADTDVYESVGLRPRHSYSVLDVQEICGHKLLRLRNPWGHFSWKGDWSDDSPLWTKDLREALGAHAAKEGVFWMSMDDLLQYFDTIDIAKHRPGWSEFRIQGSFPTSASQPCKVVVLTLERPTEVDFTLYQTWRKSEMTKSIPRDLLIIVVRAEGDQVIGEPKVMAHTRRQLKAFVSCSAMLGAGDYFVICCSFNTLNQMSGSDILGWPYVLAIHTSRPVLYSSVMRPYSLIARTLIALAVQKGNQHEGREGVTCYYLNKGWSGTVIVVENRYPEHHLHIQCDCDGSFNVIATRGTLQTADSIPPLHRQIVTILSQCVESGYTINHRIKNRMSPRPDLKDWGPPRTQHNPLLIPEVYALHSPVPL